MKRVPIFYWRGSIVNLDDISYGWYTKTDDSEYKVHIRFKSSAASSRSTCGDLHWAASDKDQARAMLEELAKLADTFVIEEEFS